MLKEKTKRPELGFVNRLMQVDDIPQVLALMMQSKFPISGVVSKAIYSALCHDAISDKRVVIGVTSNQEQIAAFLLIIVDWFSFWKSFAFGHPFLSLQIAIKRLTRMKTSTNSWDRLPQADKDYISSIISAHPSGKSWSEFSPRIAKGVFMQVDPKFRGRHLSVELYKYLMNLLADSGITRIDARVDLTNRRAMPLHVTVGYRLERDGNSLFATKDLRT